MSDIREQLDAALRGRVCVVGVGNTDYGDDGLGVRLAERLVGSAVADVCVAGTGPERYVGPLSDDSFDTCLFVDAVEFGGAPGSVVLLDSEEMASRFPQVSTHKLSLGMLAQLIQATGRTRVWLLGVQPESLKAGPDPTPAVQLTLDALEALLSELLAGHSPERAEQEVLK